MPTFSLSVPSSMLAAGRADASSFPALAEAVRSVAEQAHQQWVAFAQGEPLPNGRSVRDHSGKYAASIRLRQVGDLTAEVFSAERVAEQIETGTPARDMKVMLQTSRKTRINAKGRRFLIIPFRWSQGGGGGANALPASVGQWWKGQRASRVTGWTTRVSGSGHTVPQRVYSWGARLEKPDMSRLGIRGAGARRQMAGMVNFRATGAKSPAGKSAGGAISFRTMHEESRGWIQPAKPGLHPAKTTADLLKPVAEKAFAEAVRADLARIFGKV